MRNDLKALDAIVEVETDVDQQLVFITAEKSVDLKLLLDEVAASNDKLKEWELEN